MLTFVFVVTVVTVIVAHHFLVVRPRERRRGVEGAGQISSWVDWLPSDLSLQPNLTWTRKSLDGDLLLGVHPLLLSLVGAPRELDVLPTEFVAAGDPLIRVRRGERSLTLLSPVTGALREAVDARPDGESLGSSNEGTAWLCRIDSGSTSKSEMSWLRGENARAWLRDRYLAMRDFIQRLASGEELGYALADGGDLPVGALAQLDGDDWREFENAFLRG